MRNNKKIRIFLASSEELEKDRVYFGELIRRLHDIYIKRGIKLELIKWEDLDAAYNGNRKQDEYNEFIKGSQMFVALFHTKAGKYTLEEFELASKEFKENSYPKIYTYIKKITNGEKETDELKEFKNHLINELGYFTINYSNIESLHLSFVLQLQLIETNNPVDLKIEDSDIKLENIIIAKTSNIPFVANNKRFIDINNKITAINKEIMTFRQVLEVTPNKNLSILLKSKLEEQENLKKELKELEHSLVDTAKSIANLQYEITAERLKKAIEKFEQGDNIGANAILDYIMISSDAERNIELYEVGKIAQNNAIENIRELSLKIKLLLTEYDNKERFNEIQKVYNRIFEIARRIDLPKPSYFNIIKEYYTYLNDYALYNDAINIENDYLNYAVEIYGPDHQVTAICLNDIGKYYYDNGNYKKAIDFFNKAQTIIKPKLGDLHPELARCYINIAGIYSTVGKVEEAIELYKDAISIIQKVLDPFDEELARGYNNLGIIYSKISNKTEALICYNKALEIRENIFGLDSIEVAETLNNIAGIYISKENDKALDLYLKAKRIFETRLNEFHPTLAICYNNIGTVYQNQKQYNEAIEMYKKALFIHSISSTNDHPDIATIKSNIGVSLFKGKKYKNALQYFRETLDIRLNILGKNNLQTALTYNWIGKSYYGLNMLSQAIESFYEYEKISNMINDKSINRFYNYEDIGNTLYLLGNYKEALNYYRQVEAYMKQSSINTGFNSSKIYYCIANTLYYLQEYDRSKEYYNKTLEDSKVHIDENDEIIRLTNIMLKKLNYDC